MTSWDTRSILDHKKGGKEIPSVVTMKKSRCSGHRKRPATAIILSLFIALVLLGFVFAGLFFQLVIEPQMKSMMQMIEKNQMEMTKLQGELRARQYSSYSHLDSSNDTFGEYPFARQKRNSEVLENGGSLIAAHLVGGSGRNSRRMRSQRPHTGNFFVWSKTAGQAFSLMEVEYVDNQITFIVINKNAYYYVYSQMAYYGQGLFETGHKTMLLEMNGRESVLMSSINTQQLSSAKNGAPNRGRSSDTAYHGGVFYLYAGDKIGVMPAYVGRNHMYLAESDRAFFGLYFLHE